MDGLRAIAVLSVLLVHVAVYGLAAGDSVSGRLLAHLNVGVTVFFLISGFLLYRPFIAARSGGAGQPAVPDYAKRRLLRVYPAYFVILTLLTILPGVTGIVSGEGVSQYLLIWSLPVLHEGPGACFSPATDCGLAQTWSLVVEVTFYLVLPFYALLAARLARGLSQRAWLTRELLLLALLSIASVVANYHGSNSWITGSLLGYGLWFSLGMSFALISVAVKEGGMRPPGLGAIERRPWIPWLGALAVYAALSASLPGTPFVFSEEDRLVAHLSYALVATLLLIPAVFGDGLGGAVRRFLANPLVTWLGLISYGIFLWHFVVAFEFGVNGSGFGFWLLLLVTLAISIAAAAASYYLIERPILRLKYRRLSDLIGSRRAAPLR